MSINPDLKAFYGTELRAEHNALQKFSTNRRAKADNATPDALFDNQLKDALTLPDEVHSNAVSGNIIPFPKRPPLPIVANDYTYVMDIMYVLSWQEVMSIADERQASKRKRPKKSKKKKDDNEEEEPKPKMPYIKNTCLVIVEVTSRKIWAYPLRGKYAPGILRAFKQFLRNVNYKITRLISDSGREYNLIKAFNKKHRLFHYHQVVAAENSHHTLSRVDRAIRTLRFLIDSYKVKFHRKAWDKVISFVLNDYNDAYNASLFIRVPAYRRGHQIRFSERKRHKRIYYSPNQVWNDPELRRRIKIKDYLDKFENYAELDKIKPDGRTAYFTKVVPTKFSKGASIKGLISDTPVTFTGKIGNTFTYEKDGKTIHVPYSDILPSDMVPKKKPKERRGRKSLSEMVLNNLISLQKRLENKDTPSRYNLRTTASKVYKTTRKYNKKNKMVLTVDSLRSQPSQGPESMDIEQDDPAKIHKINGFIINENDKTITVDKQIVSKNDSQFNGAFIERMENPTYEIDYLPLDFLSWLYLAYYEVQGYKMKYEDSRWVKGVNHRNVDLWEMKNDAVRRRVFDRVHAESDRQLAEIYANFMRTRDMNDVIRKLSDGLAERLHFYDKHKT